MAPGLLLGVCAALMATAIANAASSEPASVVVGLAKCAECTRKNMNAEAVFKGLQVAIKCKNVNGDYESKALGKLDGSGAFSIPLAADLHGADCHAQLHSAAGKPCPGQEPSTITPQSDGIFVAMPGKTNFQSSAECVSATICGPMKKHIFDHFHKKLVPPKPKPEPKPEYHPPTPEYHPPTPTYGGSPTPIYHPPAMKTSDTFCGKIKKHIIGHLHKKPVPPMPKPEPKPEYHPPTPEYHHPTPTYGSPTPIYHPAALKASDTFSGKIKKHIIDHFHKKPVPPKPEYHPPKPEYHPPTPTYGGSTPIYHPPAKN